MPFVTRPHFEDRQIVQYNEDEIKLSGTSKIAPVILDFTGTTTGATTVEINGLTGYLNGQRQYGFVVEPAQLKMSGSTGTTEVDVTGYVLASMDSKGSVGWVALSGGPIGNTYVNSGSVVGNDLILNWNTGGSVPAIALPTSTFTGNTSASCITDIYVKNIHSCSPLNIQPNDEGNVYFGSTSGVTIDVSNSNLGIGTTSPLEKLNIQSTGEAKIRLDADTDDIDENETAGILLTQDGGISTANFGLSPDGINDLVIGVNSTSPPSIKFATRSDGNSFATTADTKMTITNSGSVGIGTTNPTEKLHIEGSVKIVDGTQQNGYVLTCDANGVGSWQSSSTGGTNTFVTGGTLNGSGILTLNLNDGSITNPIDLSALSATSSGTSYWVTSDGGSESIKTNFTSHYINSDNSLMGGGIDLVMSGINNTTNIMMGGDENKMISDAGFAYRNNILGGESNTMVGRMENSSILGGAENFLQGYRHSIIGGEKNSINGDSNGVILGGSGNTMAGDINLIGAGESNTLAGANRSAIIGGVGINGSTDNTLYVPNLTVREDKILHSDTVLEVADLPSTFEDEIKGSYTSFNWTGLTTSVITNSDEFGYTSYILGDLDTYPTNKRYGFVSYYNEGYEKSTAVGSTASDFYSEKLVLKAASDSEGMVISPHENDGTKALWVEHAGNSIVKILSNGPDGTPRIGVGMDPTGVENASASFQIGGTGNTASFRYLDGQETDGYVLKCDSDGYATWEEESTFTGNTSATCITDLYVSNVYGCSPITFHSSIQSNGSTASGDEAIAFGENCTSSDDKTFSFGVNNSVSGERSFIGGGIDNTIGNGNNNFIAGGDTNTVLPGVNNSVIAGGSNITASKPNTLYTNGIDSVEGLTTDGSIVTGGITIKNVVSLYKKTTTTGNQSASGVTEGTRWAIYLNGNNTVTLPDSTVSGGVLKVYVVSKLGLGNDITVTPSTFNGYTSFTLSDVGESIDLLWDDDFGWVVMGGNNYSLT